MANRVHQGYTLFQMLKAAKPDEVVSRVDIAKALGVNEGSVPIYFFGLKKYFNVDFEVVKDGRSVVGYKLLSRDAEVPMYGRRGSAPGATKPATVKKPKAVKSAKAAKNTVEKVAVKTTKKPKAVKPEVNEDIFSDMEVTEITDNELSDIRSQLGL